MPPPVSLGQRSAPRLACSEHGDDRFTLGDDDRSDEAAHSLTEVRERRQLACILAGEEKGVQEGRPVAADQIQIPWPEPALPQAIFRVPRDPQRCDTCHVEVLMMLQCDMSIAEEI
jgi:hypothetical protein